MLLPNCIQLETVSYYTDFILRFHHFLFKVVIKWDGYTPALDKLAHLILCCTVWTNGYNLYQSDSDFLVLPYQVATCTQQTLILGIT